MAAKANTAFCVGILALASVAAMVSLAGCQTSDTMAVDPTNPACSFCAHQAQAYAVSGLDYTGVICPTCESISTVDPQFLDRLEIFTGGPLGDTVYACASCRALVAQCAACRQEGALARR